MSEIISGFVNKKKAEAPFVTLANGESINVLQLKAIKTLVKQGFNGDEIEVLRLVCDVETTEGTKTKNFDNGTRKFAEQLAEKEIDLGASFTITREGEKTQTRYIISDVKKAA